MKQELDTNYPRIIKIAVEMAYDNRCINERETEKQPKKRILHNIVSEISAVDLISFESALMALSESEFEEYTHNTNGPKSENTSSLSGYEWILHHIFDIL